MLCFYLFCSLWAFNFDLESQREVGVWGAPGPGVCPGHCPIAGHVLTLGGVRLYCKREHRIIHINNLMSDIGVLLVMVLWEWALGASRLREEWTWGVITALGALYGNLNTFPASIWIKSFFFWPGGLCWTHRNIFTCWPLMHLGKPLFHNSEPSEPLSVTLPWLPLQGSWGGETPPAWSSSQRGASWVIALSQPPPSFGDIQGSVGVRPLQVTSQENAAASLPHPPPAWHPLFL